MLTGCGPQFQKIGPATVAPRLEPEALVTRDDARLALARFEPDGAPKSLVLALHSFGDFRLAFEEIGPVLAADGHLVLAIDQRGFGDDPARGIWPTGKTLVDDLEDLIAASRASWPGLPMHLLGESMGGAVIINAMARGLEGIESLVLAAPGVREGIPFRYGWNAMLYAVSLVAPGHALTNGQGHPALREQANARLGSDARIVRDVRVDTYFGLLRFADLASANARHLRLPTLLIYGDADGFVIPASICALLRDAPGPVTTRIVEGGVHRILHQDGTSQPLEDIRLWLAGRRDLPARRGVSAGAGLCDRV